MADDEAMADGTFPLLIAVAASPDDRIRLAELVDGIAPLLLVSGLDELRRLITPAAHRRTVASGSDLAGTPSTRTLAAANPPPAGTIPFASSDASGHTGTTAGGGAEFGLLDGGSSGGAGGGQVKAVLVIDGERSLARSRDREVPLTRLELGLLTCLNSRPLRTWTYADLHRTVWHSSAGDSTGDVQSLVKRLRRKLDRLGTTVTVDAVRGTGFRLSDHQHPTIT